MASENIDVRIREDGSRVVRRNIDGIASSSDRAQAAINSLNRSLRAIGAAWAVREVVQAANAYTTIQNKLGVVTKSTEELSSVTKELFAISQRTRTSFEATAQLYSRTALSTQQLGLSQERTLAFTESLNKAVIISGATAAEASAGLIQLSQGLASGRIQGDELRSVLEQLPFVADVISRHLGVTRGELRELGSQGKISAGAIVNAFEQFEDEIGKKFSKTVPTMAQSMTVLDNSFIKFIGEIDAATGISADFFKLIVQIDAILGSASFISSAIDNVKAIRIVVNAATTAFGGLIDAVIQLKIVLASLTPPGLGEWFENARKAAVGGLVDFYSESKNLASGFMNDVGNIFGKGKDFRAIIEKGMPNIGDMLKGVGGLGDDKSGEEIKAIKEKAAEIRKALDETTKGGKGGAGRAAKELERLENALERVLRVADPTRAIIMQLSQDEEVLTKSVSKGLITADQKAEIMDRLKVAYQEQMDPLGFMLQKLEEEQTLLGLTSNQREVEIDLRERTLQLQKDGINLTTSETDALRNQLTVRQRQMQVQSEVDALHATGAGALEELKIKYDALNQAVANGSITTQQYSADLLQLQLDWLNLKIVMGDASFSDTILAGIGKIVEGYQGLLPGLSSAFGNFFEGLTNGFANVVGQVLTGQTTLKEGFHQLATTILSELISALVKLGIQWLISATIGNAIATASAAASAALAAGTAAAWAPAAAVVSLATFGANSVPAMAGITATFALTQALSSIGGLLGGGGGSFLDAGTSIGGSVAFAADGGAVRGPGGPRADMIPAMLSNGEFVVNAHAAQNNRMLLELINSNRMSAMRFAQGGHATASLPPAYSPSSSGGGFKITVNNYAPGVKVDAQQISADEVLLMIREETPKVISAQIGEPNSKVSKALGRSTTAGRRRG